MSLPETSIDYLGHIIFPNGVEPGPSKTEDMVKLPVPTSLNSYGDSWALRHSAENFLKVTLPFHLTEESSRLFH